MKTILSLRITKIAALIIGGYIILSTTRNIISLWSAKDRISQAQTRLNQLEAQNTKLKQEITQVGDADFIQREAREKLGLVKPGEVVLVLPQEEIDRLAQNLREEYVKSTQPPIEPTTWQKWLKLFTD